MKRLFFIALLAALLLGCEFMPAEYLAEYTVQVANDTDYSIDVTIGEMEISATSPRSEAAAWELDYLYLEDERPQKSFAVYISEHGYPLISRGTLTAAPGGAYLVTVYFDFYDNEYRFSVTSL